MSACIGAVPREGGGLQRSSIRKNESLGGGVKKKKMRKGTTNMGRTGEIAVKSKDIHQSESSKLGKKSPKKKKKKVKLE